MTGAEAAGTHFVGRLGQLEPFDESGTDWASYEERLTSFLIVNRVPDSDKVHAFLSIMGSKTYGLLKSLAAPELPSTKSFEALKKVLSDHLSPKPSVIGERAKFHRRCQREGESISNFVAELRKLSQTCEFGSALDESLRDRFVCGLLREDIQLLLFTEDSKLTFQKTVERALAMEAAKKSAAEARGSDATVGDVHKVQAESLKADDHQRRLGEHGARHGSAGFRHVNDAVPSALSFGGTGAHQSKTSDIHRSTGITSGRLFGQRAARRLFCKSPALRCGPQGTPFTGPGVAARRPAGVDENLEPEQHHKELRYLGHRISAEGISATAEKVDALLKAPAPKDKQQLRSFLGVVSFYGKFLPNLATVAQPFFGLLRKNAPWCWDALPGTVCQVEELACVSTDFGTLRPV
ncbi:uncharacterized protein LOC144160897 [Haemaphysalis longicornis]